MMRMYTFGKTLGKEMQSDRATGLAAEQAFFYMLSLFPLLILILSVLPYFSMDMDRLMFFIETVLPPQTAAMIEENVIHVVKNDNSGLLTFGVIGTIWSASAGMNAFIKAMNEAFNVKKHRPIWKARFLSIVLTFGMLTSLIIIFILSIFGELLLDMITSYFTLPEQTEVLFQILRWVLTIAVMIALLCCLYFFSPKIKLSFRYVLPGAITATILWQLISFGFSFYVSNFGNYSATYGSLGGVIVLMLWLFLTGLSLVIGGEINAIIHKNRRYD
ncbi:YihY/virulence factor BrkB family protein [Salibacterium salarium]|uniref:YihY/virulence factor BrkB family protein n=1 Tax=Salibacterium salarium TaxID=284579 RepID=A0A428MXM5_9BACI|nr:YihY/virulence factor BrkB family protein [Salibacterium salarium]RSL30884.1 YihY/virulence factor BrkB family protein [Salibacterium salarium]